MDLNFGLAPWVRLWIAVFFVFFSASGAWLFTGGPLRPPAPIYPPPAESCAERHPPHVRPEAHQRCLEYLNSPHKRAERAQLSRLSLQAYLFSVATLLPLAFFASLVASLVVTGISSAVGALRRKTSR